MLMEGVGVDLSITEEDLRSFNQGEDSTAYRILGAHIWNVDNKTIVRFAVWAPNAVSVSVVGDFNGWDGNANPMDKLGMSGVWQCFVENIPEYSLYKYQIRTMEENILFKADPYAFYSELRPNTASKICRIDNFQWEDKAWLENRTNVPLYNRPVAIYEVHLGSWKRKADGSFLSYRELEELIDYVCDMGYTHIELMPITEHPLDDSWGYQVTGYYAVTSRFGTPQEFSSFINLCHKKGIGVILDWVPAHFPKDAHGLARFDGTALYEYWDSRIGEHKEWGTYVFNYARYEVISFLISSAMFWFDVYHIDGLRVDAVSSMLYRNYGRADGEWLPNQYGGNENLEAIAFLKKLHEKVYAKFPNVLMIAEESTAWPSVTGPTYSGALGFSHKWNMGWMHDILDYMSLDPYFRSGSHSKLTFSLMYAYTENFILPFSHDEVVHGKKSLLDKMPGAYWDKFANLRALYGYMYAHPGKKLLFMGGEFGQFIEWRFYAGLDWNLLDYDMHRKLKDYVKDLNYLYRKEKALWEKDTTWEGFQWINADDSSRSVISFIRSGENHKDDIIILCNFTPVTWENYVVGVPQMGDYSIVSNSDEIAYGGFGVAVTPKNNREPWLSFPNSLTLNLPPLSTIYLKLRQEDSHNNL